MKERHNLWMWRQLAGGKSLNSSILNHKAAFGGLPIFFSLKPFLMFEVLGRGEQTQTAENLP